MEIEGVHSASIGGSPKEQLFQIMLHYAYEKKHVRLASGQESDVYIDCRQVYFRAEALSLIGGLFYDLLCVIEPRLGPYQACGGMAIGAIPLGASLSMAAYQARRNLPGLCVRKETKDHGTKVRIEGTKGIPPGSRVLMVEDVVTTGGSTLQAASELRAFGYEVNAVLALVDRKAGGRANLAVSGIELFSLFSLEDFQNLN